jgi:hypothetical protein
MTRIIKYEYNNKELKLLLSAALDVLEKEKPKIPIKLNNHYFLKKI